MSLAQARVLQRGAEYWDRGEQEQRLVAAFDKWAEKGVWSAAAQKFPHTSLLTASSTTMSQCKCKHLSTTMSIKETYVLPTGSLRTTKASLTQIRKDRLAFEEQQRANAQFLTAETRQLISEAAINARKAVVDDPGFLADMDANDAGESGYGSEANAPPEDLDVDVDDGDASTFQLIQ
ncbi:uncharacterized protein F5147DRAFT_766331 [Suillus discolor]|uniref:Uncharacterized protein n=1 Tax=Suillus discolor TaxID=1912936 RepID=A0A9P7FJX1_9AGAM|nr:uncharacterized protein F5147DRAFT_766331 [Suillus discolor]KAG2120416.1 hypothetical protein F5147DRAFT_766331 [Suillus discolor]